MKTRKYLTAVLGSLLATTAAAFSQTAATPPASRPAAQAPVNPVQPGNPVQTIPPGRVNPPNARIVPPGQFNQDPNMPQNNNPAINRGISPMPVLTNPAPIPPGINQMPGLTNGVPFLTNSLRGGFISNSFPWNSNTVAPWMTNRPPGFTNRPPWLTNRSQFLR